MPYRIIPLCIVAAMDPRDFFLELLKRRGLTPNGLAQVLQDTGKTETNLQSHFAKWLSNPAKEPKVQTMLPVAEYFGVNLGAFYRPKEARAELNRLNGLDHTAEVVTRVTRTPKLFDQALFDDLPQQQQQDIAKITADIVAAFARYNEPNKGKTTAWPKRQHESDVMSKTLKGVTPKKKKGGSQ